MAVELRVPQAGESITEVQIGEWLKKPGDPVERDETVVVIETDKAAMELPAPATGTLASVLKNTGEIAKPGDVIGLVAEEGEAPATRPTGEAPAVALPPEESAFAERVSPVPGEAPPLPSTAAPIAQPPVKPPAPAEEKPRVTPIAAQLMVEHGLRAEDVTGSGPAGRVTREDVLRVVEAQGKHAAEEVAPPEAPQPRVEAPAAAEKQPVPQERPAPAAGEPEEEIVPMTLLRRRVAERLVQAQQTAALLTTFNEIDMSAVSALRREHQDAFKERHGVKLGFMSFFVRACVDALKATPQLNAEIRGTDIVYRKHFDIGIAIGSGRGLVVPVLRSTERMGFADIEKAINDFARRAQENKLTVEELQGGTFTITNGGIYGSLLSTPIVNPPQSGILGMHAIQDRPVAREGQVVIRPMMYVALTYDHRIVDGREAVTFLKRIKDTIEEPARMLLEV